MLIGLLILALIVWYCLSVAPNDSAKGSQEVISIKEQEKQKMERERNAEREAEAQRRTQQDKKRREWLEREEQNQKKRKRISTQTEWESRKRKLLSLNESTYKKLQQGMAYDGRIHEAKSEVSRIEASHWKALSECSSALNSGFGWKTAHAHAEEKADQIKQQLEDARKHVKELEKERRNAYDRVDITSDEIQGLILGSLEGRYQVTESEILKSNSYLAYLSQEDRVVYSDIHFGMYWKRLSGAFEQLKKDGLIIDSRIFPRDSQKLPTYRLTDKMPSGEQIQRAVFASMADVDKMDGHKFEQFCADLLRKVGFHSVEVTKGSGDQGVDIIAVQGSKRYAIQCKRYSSRLGNTPVQEVHAGKDMYNCQVGAVLTNQYFTSGAQELAESTWVLLWDRDELERLIKMANN